MAEDRGEHRSFEYIQQCCEHQRRHAQQHHKLLARVAGVFLLPPADVLPRHHGAAGGHGGENVDHQIADRIHQRYRRNSGLAHGGHHQRIRKPHRDRQQLLQQQRPDQSDELSVCKFNFLFRRQLRRLRSHVARYSLLLPFIRLSIIKPNRHFVKSCSARNGNSCVPHCPISISRVQRAFAGLVEGNRIASRPSSARQSR